MITVYGIKNCDTIKKTLRWLDEQQITYQFHDLRKDRLSADTLQHWIDQVGWQTLLNTRGTTWRTLAIALPEDCAQAHALMLAHPTLIKRPVIEHQGQVWVGFSTATLSAIQAR